MKSKYLAISCLFLLLFSHPLVAEESYQDFFRSTGKINTVLAVVVILFVVLILCLVRLERKISKLEKQINNER